MNPVHLAVITLTSCALASGAATHYAARVVSYDPGNNFAAGYTNAEVVLGEPSRLNPFGESVDPFNPPYGTNQVLSIGEGGSLTIQFDHPIFNGPRHRFGIDFTIFGNSGFVITNDFDPITFEWIGTPATDGSLFAQNTGATRVSVSRNGKHFFVLDPEQAPPLDVLYPTDASGAFDLPVNPALTQTSFAGATLADLAAAYGGSGGGAGFDIAWGRTAKGRRVHLAFVRYVRIEVLQGKVEVDALVATARQARGHSAAAGQ